LAVGLRARLQRNEWPGLLGSLYSFAPSLATASKTIGSKIRTDELQLLNHRFALARDGSDTTEFEAYQVTVGIGSKTMVIDREMVIIDT
jgi:hypothetical protein